MDSKYGKDSILKCVIRVSLHNQITTCCTRKGPHVNPTRVVAVSLGLPLLGMSDSEGCGTGEVGVGPSPANAAASGESDVRVPSDHKRVRTTCGCALRDVPQCRRLCPRGTSADRPMERSGQCAAPAERSEGLVGDSPGQV